MQPTHRVALSWHVAYLGHCPGLGFYKRPNFQTTLTVLCFKAGPRDSWYKRYLPDTDISISAILPQRVELATKIGMLLTSRFSVCGKECQFWYKDNKWVNYRTKWVNCPIEWVKCNLGWVKHYPEWVKCQNGLLFSRNVHQRDVSFPCVVHGIKSTALFLGQIADTKSAVIVQMAVAFVHTIFRIMLGGFSLYLLLAFHPYLRGQHFYFILVLLFR